MRLKNLTIEKNFLLLAYKLSYDLLLLLLVTLAGTLLVEGLIPGLVSSKISFNKLIFALFLILSLIAYLSKNINLDHTKEKATKSKILPIFTLFSFLLIGNSLLKFSFWENIIVTLTTLFVFFLLFELMFSSKRK